MAISASTVNYNLPGLNSTNLKLDGPALVGIYTGKIRSWDDKPITALNPDVKLPHHDIIPIHRDDGSGDTFVFTQYLTFSTPSWENTIGYGTSIKWPTVPGSLSADGNLGVLRATQQTPYSISYIGISFHKELPMRHSARHSGIPLLSKADMRLHCRDAAFEVIRDRTFQPVCSALLELVHNGGGDAR